MDGKKLNGEEETEYFHHKFKEVDARIAKLEALSPKIQGSKTVDMQSKQILKHLEPRYTSYLKGNDLHLEHYPQIIVQKASSRASACKLHSCKEMIKPGHYRIALRPGIEGWRCSPGKPHRRIFAVYD